MAVRQRSSKVQQVVLVLFLVCVWTGAEEVASDGTVPAEPLSVVPPPVQVASAPVNQPVSSSQPVPVPAVAPAKYPDLSGTSTQTKNPDGSIITVTQFKGQLPPNAFHQPYGPYGGFPGWGPASTPFYYPWGGPQYQQAPYAPPKTV